jgi:hypothetical protein
LQNLKKTDELKAASNKLKKLPKDKVSSEMKNKVLSTYKYHANRMGEALNEKEALENEIQEYMSSVFIYASEKMYQGVKLIVGDFHDRTKREYGPSKMIYKERKIIVEPIVNT